MPFVRVELAGTAGRDQKAAIVADITRSLVDRLGKSPAAVQVVIAEHDTTNYGAAGILIADRDAGVVLPPREVAPANGAG